MLAVIGPGNDNGASPALKRRGTDQLMQPNYDIVIVGAGMVGAALALKLGRTGFQVALLDRAAPPVFDAHGLPDIRVSAISAASEALLRELGAWPAMEAMRLCPYRRLAVWEQTEKKRFPGLPHHFNRTEFTATEVGQSRLGHIVENRVTQQALWQQLEQLDNVDLIVPAQMEQLSVTDAAAELRLADGRALSAHLIVGADGARSQIREWAQLGLSRSQYPQQALVATVSYQGRQEDITWQAFTPEGPRAFLPLASIDGQAWASLVWYDQPQRLEALQELPESDFLAQVAQAFPCELPPLQTCPERARFPLFRSHAQAYARDRVVLAGDAAHTINPLAGQGVNLGFQDAQALSDVLNAARAGGEEWSSAQILRRYEAQRRPANERMMAIMDLFYHSFSNRRAPLFVARNLGLALAAHLPPARREVTRYAMGLESGLSARMLRWLDRLPKPPLPSPW